MPRGRGFAPPFLLSEVLYMKENKAQMRGIKYLWHNLEYILAAVFFVIMLVALFIQVPYQGRWNAVGVTERLYEGKPARGLGQ